jgi:hypothetical protein
MENREKQLQELKKEYQDIHMSEEQLLQMKLKIKAGEQPAGFQCCPQLCLPQTLHRTPLWDRRCCCRCRSGHLTEHLRFRCLRNEPGSCALQAC